MSKYKLNKKCPTCGKRLLDKNKSGFCNKHRDRTGKNNPFFGKKHKRETIEKTKKKLAEKSKKNWQNKKYREKVIKAISKPRGEKFKEEQSKRITKWYKDNPEQKIIRSNKMKESWRKGKIIPMKKIAYRDSKIQKKFFNELFKICPYVSEGITIISENKWFFPDIVVNNCGLIIEFLGDYWHANPKIYSKDDICAHHHKAKDIWERDANRKEEIENLGYFVYEVWESDYKNDKDSVFRRFDALLNWESCAL